MHPALAIPVTACLLVLSVAATPLEQKKIEDLYRRSLAGEKPAVLECIAALEALLEREPQNQVARVYLGSAYTLQSRDLGFGPKKLSTLKRGVAVMDEAVAAAPNDPKIRLTRALTTSALPGFLGYRARSRQDFQTLAQMADAQPAKFEEGDLQIVYYHAGLVAKATGDRAQAVARWQKALAHPADPKLAEKIRTELAAL